MPPAAGNPPSHSAHFPGGWGEFREERSLVHLQLPGETHPISRHSGHPKRQDVLAIDGIGRLLLVNTKNILLGSGSRLGFITAVLVFCRAHQIVRVYKMSNGVKDIEYFCRISLTNVYNRKVRNQ